MCVLRGDEPDLFGVRARHSTLYPVELPHWLPSEVAEEMVQRFRKYLRCQLEVMVKDHNQKPATAGQQKKIHRRTVTVESDSAFSIATEASQRSDLQPPGTWPDTGLPMADAKNDLSLQ